MVQNTGLPWTDEMLKGFSEVNWKWKWWGQQSEKAFQFLMMLLKALPFSLNDCIFVIIFFIFSNRFCDGIFIFGYLRSQAHNKERTYHSALLSLFSTIPMDQTVKEALSIMRILSLFSSFLAHKKSFAILIESVNLWNGSYSVLECGHLLYPQQQRGKLKLYPYEYERTAFTRLPGFVIIAWMQREILK